jgi:hypothetical protein
MSKNEAPYHGPRHDHTAAPAHRPADPHKSMPTGQRPAPSPYHSDARTKNISK